MNFHKYYVLDTNILLEDATFINYIPKVVENAEIISAENLNDGFQKLIKGKGDYFITFSRFYSDF